jgi:hypothetical protein
MGSLCGDGLPSAEKVTEKMRLEEKSEVAAISRGRGFLHSSGEGGVAKRAAAFRSQLQLSAVPAFTLGDEMKKTLALFSTLRLLASASAEIKSIDLSIFGTD